MLSRTYKYGQVISQREYDGLRSTLKIHFKRVDNRDSSPNSSDVTTSVNFDSNPVFTDFGSFDSTPDSGSTFDGGSGFDGGGAGGDW